MIIKQNDGLSFELNETDLTAQVIYSPNARENVFIPSSISYQSKEYFITSIQECSFKNNTKLTSITFSDDSKLVSICKKAFVYSSIESLTIPSSVKNLEEGWCMYTCNLKHINISPDNKYYKYLNEDKKIIVGKSNPEKEDFDVIVFASRDVDRAYIPSKIKHVSSFAFCDCNMKSIEYEKTPQLETIGEKGFDFLNTQKNIFIPASVKVLKDGWIGKIYESFNITISPENKSYKYIDNGKIIVGKSDPEKDDFDVLVFANRNIEQIVIPSSIKHINSNAFFHCENLKKVTFEKESNLVSIGKSSFQFTSIQSINIPSKVERIEKDAFSGCKRLRLINFPLDSELCSISKRAFFDILIMSITIPPNLQVLKEGWCSKTTYLNHILISRKNKNFSYLDNEQKIIVGKSDLNSECFDVIVFACRQIKEAFIPSTIKYIDSFAFSQCTYLERVTFAKDSQLKSIHRNAFSNSASLTSIEIPSSLEQISAFAFYNCSNLRTFTIPKNSNLKNIQKWAFFNTAIQNLFIPSNVDNLEECWIEGMRHLTKVSISSENRHFGFIDDDQNIIAYRSDINCEKYDSILCSYGFFEKVVIPSYIQKISTSCFEQHEELETVEFEQKSQLKIIEYNAFSHTSIEEITIPKHVNFIGGNAFSYCMNLRKIDFEEDSELTVINNGIFEISTIESLSIPASVTKFREDWSMSVYDLNDVYLSPENKCFTYSDEDKKIIIGKSDENSECFDVLIFACRNIKNAIIPKTIKYINAHSFLECLINKVFIPKNVIRIAKSAFASCNQLKSLEFEEGGEMLTIELNAFMGTQIENVLIPTKNAQIDLDAFFNSSLKTLEFLGENIFIENIADNKDLFLISFPNALNIRIIESSFICDVEQLSIFTVPGREINTD